MTVIKRNAKKRAQKNTIKTFITGFFIAVFCFTAYGFASTQEYQYNKLTDTQANYERLKEYRLNELARELENISKQELAQSVNLSAEKREVIEAIQELQNNKIKKIEKRVNTDIVKL